MKIFSVDQTSGRQGSGMSLDLELQHKVMRQSTVQFIVLKVENEEGNPIEVQVMNEYNDSVYTEVFKNKSDLQRKFNISKTDSQSLTFVVNVKGKQFTKTIELY